MCMCWQAHVSVSLPLFVCWCGSMYMRNVCFHVFVCMPRSVGSSFVIEWAVDSEIKWRCQSPNHVRLFCDSMAYSLPGSSAVNTPKALFDFLKICSFQNISTYFVFCPCASSQELSPTKMFHSCVCECLLQTSPPQRQYSLKLSAKNNNYHSESLLFTFLIAIIIFYPLPGLLCSWLSSFTIETRMLLHLPLNLSHTRYT